MGLITSLLIFIIVWWVVFFMVLPIGIRTQSDDGIVEDGTDPGAPTNLNMVNKILITSGITIVLWLIIFVLVSTGVLSIYSGDSNPWAKS
jgi:predicted secreted protein